MATIIPNTPIVNSGFLYVNKLSLSTISDSALNLSSGKARDSTDTVDIVLDADITLSFLHVGVNGLDQGVVEQGKSYAIYVIFDSTGYQPTAGIISLDIAAPKLPVGYDSFRRIGWVATDTSFPTAKIINFYQYGVGRSRRYVYDSDQLVTAVLDGSDIAFANIPAYPAVPKISTEVQFNCKYLQTNAANRAQFLPGSATDITEGMVIVGSGSLSTQWHQFTLPMNVGTLGFSELQYKLGPTGTADRVTLYVTGYKDNL
jgi:hypothetical protein